MRKNHKKKSKIRLDFETRLLKVSKKTLPFKDRCGTLQDGNTSRRQEEDGGCHDNASESSG